MVLAEEVSLGSRTADRTTPAMARMSRRADMMRAIALVLPKRLRKEVWYRSSSGPNCCPVAGLGDLEGN